MSSHIMVLVSGSGAIPGTERIWKCTKCGKVGQASLIRQPCPARPADKPPGLPPDTEWHKGPTMELRPATKDETDTPDETA